MDVVNIIQMEFFFLFLHKPFVLQFWGGNFSSGRTLWSVDEKIRDMSQAAACTQKILSAHVSLTSCDRLKYSKILEHPSKDLILGLASDCMF